MSLVAHVQAFHPPSKLCTGPEVMEKLLLMRKHHQAQLWAVQRGSDIGYLQGPWQMNLNWHVMVPILCRSSGSALFLWDTVNVLQQLGKVWQGPETCCEWILQMWWTDVRTPDNHEKSLWQMKAQLTGWGALTPLTCCLCEQLDED